MRCTLCPKAVAWIQGGKAYPQIHGLIKFYQKEDGVIVEAEITGLPQTETGYFAFHIHEGNSCTGEGFPRTGSHYNPVKMSHPNHAGDLPPLLSSHGKAYMKVLTNRFSVSEIIGRTLIIHSDPDDFHTQPSGNAGMKIACGVIQRL